MPEKPTRREFLDAVLSASAGIVALCALAVSIYQAKLARDQQRASVWPRLDLTNNNGPHHYARLIRNVGLGPALVRSMEITLDGRPLLTWEAVAGAVLGPGALPRIAADTALHSTFSTIHRGSVLLPSVGIEQIRLEGGSVPDSLSRIVGEGRLVWRTCYCSLYGDCWTVTSLEPDPTPVRACPEQPDMAREFRN